MFHKPLGVLVSIALVLSSISVSAQTAPPKQDQTAAATSADASKNQSPLPPGGAAGVQEAQGLGTNELLIIGGVILVGVLVAVLLSQSNSESTPSTP